VVAASELEYAEETDLKANVPSGAGIIASGARGFKETRQPDRLEAFVFTA
jgi:hypothetical protein